MNEQVLLIIDTIRENNYDINMLQNFNIKSYLPLSVKKLIIKKVLDLCVVEDDIKKIDFALKEFAYEYMMISNYTNITFELEEVMEVYDELKEHELIDKIIKLIPDSEKNFIKYVLEKEIEQIQLVDNSLASSVSKQLSKLVEKLPDSNEINKMIPKLSKQINKISPESFKLLTDAIGWSKGNKNA